MRLDHANKALLATNSRSATLESDLQQAVTSPSTTVAATAAAAAAESRAAAAETALSEALEAVEELEARCASAQAREVEAGREASARVDELAQELQEATENGPKVATPLPFAFTVLKIAPVRKSLIHR